MNRLQELFLAASGMPKDRRHAWLSEQCGTDEVLLREVLSLLDHDFSKVDLMSEGMDHLRDEAQQVREKIAKNLEDEDDETGSIESDAKQSSESNSLDQTGRIIGPFKLLQRLGEGGMGTVYMAEQSKPVRRRVAVKVIKRGLDSKQVIARFEAERQALAMMDHNHIARVLDAGTTDDGQPFFAMELVKGVPITQYCDKNKLTVQERIELFMPVCHAIQHAHQKGIIHRDIKPSNVLVCLYDGLPVPKVIDFGVAKATHQQLTEKTMFTTIGQVVGTVEYMAPEQADMNQLDVDTRCDIYSLGVMLYQLLTGTTPISGAQLRRAGFSQMLKTIREHEPPKPSTRISESGDELPAISQKRKAEPSRLSRMLRGELDWVVMKALEKDRTRRYETANGFALDLKRYLENEPVEAGPPSATYRLRKLTRKHRSLLVTAATMSVVLVVATIVSLSMAYRASVAKSDAKKAASEAVEAKGIADDRSKDLQAALISAKQEKLRAEKQEDLAKSNAFRAETSERRTKRLLYRSDMREAVAALNNFEVGRVRNLLLRHIPENGATDNRGFVWKHLWNRIHDFEHRFIQGSAIRRIDLSSDGKVLMTSGAHYTYRFWNPLSREHIGMIQFPQWTADAVSLSPDGNFIASSGYSRHNVTIVDRKTFEKSKVVEFLFGRPEAIAWSADAQQIACTFNNGKGVALLDLQSSKLKQHWHFRDSVSGNAVCFSPDSKFLACGPGHGDSVRLIDTSTGESKVLKRSHSRYSRDAIGRSSFSPDSRLLATCGLGGVELWDLQSKQLVATYQDGSVYWCNIAWHPDSKSLYVCGGDKLIELSGTDLAFQRRIIGHEGRLTGVKLTSDGSRLISSSIDGTILVRRIDQSYDSSQNVVGAHFLNNHDLVWVERGGMLNRLTKGKPNERMRLLENHRVLYSAVRDDGGAFALAQSFREVSLWDLSSGEKLHSNIGRGEDSFTSHVHALAFQPTGKLLAISMWDETYLVDSEDYSFKGRFRSYRSHALSFTPDGKHFAVGHGEHPDADQRLLIYSVDNETPVARVHATVADVRAVAFSSDGEQVASAGSERVIRLSRWMHSGEEIRLLGHQDTVSAIVFSPDGKLLVSGDLSGDVCVWSVPDRELIANFHVSTLEIKHLDFSDDGTQVAIASSTGVTILNASQGDAVGEQVETAKLLSSGDVDAFFVREAKRSSQPEYLVSAAQRFFWKADDAVRDNRLTVAIEYLDLAVAYLNRSNFNESYPALKVLGSNLYQRVLLTRWGCATERSTPFDAEELFGEIKRHGNFYSTISFDGYSWALKRGLSHFRRAHARKQPLDSAWQTRLAPFLTTSEGIRLMSFYNTGVRLIGEDDQAAYVYTLENIPDGELRITHLGTGAAPLRGSSLLDSDFDWLNNQAELSSMVVDVGEAPEGFWKRLANLKQLKSLALKNWSGRDRKQVEAIARLKNLESLTFDNSFVGFEHLDELRTLAKLRRLSIMGSWLSVDNVRALQAFPGLEELELTWSTLNDEAMPELAKLSHLEVLLLDGTPVSPVGLSAFAGHKSLRRLDLFDSKIGDDSIDALTKIPHLEAAGLVDTNVSWAGISKLRTALPNCLVMHQDGYLNIGRDVAPDSIARDTTPETQFFPSLSQLSRLIESHGQKLADLESSAETESATEESNFSAQLSTLRRALRTIQNQESGSVYATKASQLLRRLPSPLTRIDRTELTEKIPYRDANERPIDLVGVIGSDRLCYAHPGEARTAFVDDDSTVIAVPQSGYVHRFDCSDGACQSLTMGKRRIVSLSADGKTAVSTDGDKLTLWSTDTAKILHELSLPDLKHCSISADANALLVARADDSLELRDCEKPESFRSIPYNSTAKIVAIKPIPNGSGWVIREQDGTVTLLDGEPLDRLSSFSTPAIERLKHIDSLIAVSDDGSRVAVAFNEPNSDVYVWDRNTNAVVWHFSTGAVVNGGSSRTSAITLSPDGKTLVALDEDGNTGFWDVAERKLLGKVLTRSSWNNLLSISRDGATVAVSDEYGITLVDTATRRIVAEPEIPLPNNMVFSDGSALHVGSLGIQTWDLRSLQKSKTVGFPTPSRLYGRAGNGHLIVGKGKGAIQRLFFVNPFDGGEYGSVYFKRNIQPSQMAVSGNGSTAAIFDGKDRVEVWNLSTGMKRLDFQIHGEFMRLAISSAGDQCAVVTSRDNSARTTLAVFRLLDGRQTYETTEECEILTTTFSPDGSVLVWSERNNLTSHRKIRRRLLPDGVELAAIQADPNLIAISPDGSLMAISMYSGKLIVYDMKTAEKLSVSSYPWRLGNQHRRATFGRNLMFSPDGNHVLVAHNNGTILVFRIEQANLPFLAAPKRNRSEQTAIEFDATTGKVRLPSLQLNHETGVTIEAWVKPEGRVESRWGPNFLRAHIGDSRRTKVSLMVREHVGYAAIVQKMDDGKYLDYRAARDQTAALSDEPSETPWSHVAAVLDDDQMVLYVDGRKVATRDVSVHTFVDTWDFAIGENFIGKIDEIRISDTARYSSDFDRHREFESDEQTVALYHFDQNDDGIVYDHSGHRNHTRIDTARWTEVP